MIDESLLDLTTNSKMLKADEARARSENPNLYNTFELIKESCKWGNRSAIVDSTYLNEANRVTLKELGYKLTEDSFSVLIQW
jgi:hypothetical protein